MSDKIKKIIKKYLGGESPSPLSLRSQLTRIIILCCVLVCVLIATGILILLLNKGEEKKLETPIIKVEQLYNGTVLESTEIDGAVSYEFELTNIKTNIKENLPLFSSNIVELKSYLNKVGEFSVRVRAIAKNDKLTSDYSNSVNFINYKQLETPQIDIKNLVKENESSLLYKTNEDISDDVISWNSIDNASYYLVRYGANIENETINTETISNTDGMINFSLSKIYKNGTGSYQISVIAMPEESSYYLASEYQKIITVEYYSKQDDVVSSNYNKETKNLEFSLNSNSIYGNEFEVYLIYVNETKEHKIYLDKCEKSTNGNVITLKTNLTQIDCGNIISMKIKALGDGKYSTDSNLVDVTIN